MNILLVYPEFPDTFWSFKHALRFVSLPAARVNYRCCYAAGGMEETFGRFKCPTS
jgi:hypothetical protein